MQPKSDKRLKLPIGRHEAKQWAYEFYAQAMAGLPPQIRHNIDWDFVASDLQGENPDDSIPLDVLSAIFQIVDYLIPSSPQPADVVHEDIIEAAIEVKDWADGLDGLRNA